MAGNSRGLYNFETSRNSRIFSIKKDEEKFTLRPFNIFFRTGYFRAKRFSSSLILKEILCVFFNTECCMKA